MIKLVVSALFAALLAGCTMGTPILLAEAGGHQLARNSEDLKVRYAAALREEPDLLTFSLQAISRGKTEEAVNTYMKGYSDSEYNDNMKSLALYQIALLYMNRFNDDRDDRKALRYFERHKIEFPNSRLEPRINERVALIEERLQQPLQRPSQLLTQVNRKELLKRDDTPYDDELTDMSARAISENRTTDAESVYLVLYSNDKSSEEMRAKALYQIGLIYMSPFNHQGDNKKAMAFFRKITSEFPNTATSKQAQNRIGELINRQ